MGRRRAARLLWALALALFALLAVKFFFADVYPVDSDSMRPTIFGGRAPNADADFTEWVLVLYDKAPELERFDLAVVKPGGGGNPIVKRVVALPGERVLIAEGDLVIEGARLPADARRPAAIPVFDSRSLDVAHYFWFDEALWSNEGELWCVNALDVQRNSLGGMMLFNKKVRDDYLDERQARVTGLAEVNDGIVECEARLEPPFDEATARLRLRLIEEGDSFEAQIEPDGEGGFIYRITRYNQATALTVLDEGPIAFQVDLWHVLRFANVDNHLSLVLDDALQGSVSYAENATREDHGNVLPPDREEDKERGASRFGFGAEGCRASFRSIVLLRDLFYTREGEYAVDAPLSLGPDEYFLLGDNSSQSRDSRHFGEVAAAEIAGRPVAVVWPPSRFRLLR